MRRKVCSGPIGGGNFIQVRCASGSDREVILHASMKPETSHDPYSNFVEPSTGKMTVLDFSARMHAMQSGLEPWGHMPLADAAEIPGFWRQLLLSRIFLAPLAGELTTNPVALAALAKAVQAPDIESMVQMRSERAPNEHIPCLTGPAYCVLVGVPLPEEDDDFHGEWISGWDAVVALAESPEEAAATVQRAVENERPSRPRVVLSEAQLRGLAAHTRRVALGQIPPDNPND